MRLCSSRLTNSLGSRTKWRFSGLFVDLAQSGCVVSGRHRPEENDMDDIKEPGAETDQDADGEERVEKVVNRPRLVDIVTEKTGLPRAKARSAIEAVFDAVGHSLRDGKEVRVLNFGSFVVSERNAGKARDPSTGVEIDVPESKSVRFRPSKALRDMVAETII